MNLDGLTFDDVLLRPQKGRLYSRKYADISVPQLGLKIPLISAPMPSVASTQLLTEITRLGGLGVVHRMNRTTEEMIADFNSAHGMPAVAYGFSTQDFAGLYEAGVRCFVLDVAHAHSNLGLAEIEDAKSWKDDIFLIAGNVATQEGAIQLAMAGADAIKVGIGPGSVCTTRQVTGFGVPQLEAIQQCSDVNVPIIADGGIRNSGDIVKALAAGADAVMIGSLFANSIEANNGGMHYGCASKRVNGHHAPEGMEKEVEGLEPLEDIVKRLTWGIRSGISYGGATNIRELQENAEWIRISDAGRVESKLV
jgi:IMP dehydrogenase/GMP reductase